MNPVRLVFMGTPELARTVLAGLAEDPRFQILAVVVQPDKPTGRGLQLTPPPVKVEALARGLPVLQPLKAREPAFLEQLRVIKKMGSLKDLLGMIPGMDKAMRNVQLDDKAFSRVEAIILSMTGEERNNPRILSGSRRRRIAMGSGSSIADVNRLLSQFEDMQKMMKAVSQSQNNPVQRLRGMKMPNFKIPTGFKR